MARSASTGMRISTPACWTPGVTLQHEFKAGRSGWLQVVRGALGANGLALQAGDGLALRDIPALAVAGNRRRPRCLLFDMG